MQVSINQLAELTGRDRRTITRRLEDLPFSEGEKGAHLYDARTALDAIYLSQSPRDALDEKRCAQIDLQMEISRKQRIPMKIVAAIWDAALQSFTATLKAAKGKKLDAAKINELIALLRDAKLPVTW